MDFSMRKNNPKILKQVNKLIIGYITCSDCRKPYVWSKDEDEDENVVVECSECSDMICINCAKNNSCRECNTDYCNICKNINCGCNDTKERLGFSPCLLCKKFFTYYLDDYQRNTNFCETCR